MTWPFVSGGPMPRAPRGQGNLGVRDGGEPIKKEMPYSHPKTTEGGKVATSPGKGTNHGNCGTQGCR